ncbi:MAG: hypothetical protein R3A78_03245 [Polyangiales bacterium]
MNLLRPPFPRWSAALLLAGVIGGCPAPDQSPPAKSSPPIVFDDVEPDAGEPMADSSVTPQCSPPTHMILRSMPDGAIINPGWSGIAHNIGIPDNVVYAAKVFDCDESCTKCFFRGPVSHSLLPFNAQRCIHDTTKTCESDSDCQGGPCRFFYGPGLETIFNVGIEVPVCIRNYFEDLTTPMANGLAGNPDTSPVQGTVDFGTGDITVTTLNLHTEETFGVCNKCIYDLEYADGQRNGQCESGFPPPSCDTQGAGAGGQKYSLDCELAFEPLGEFTLQLGPMRTGKRELVLTDQSPDCGAAAGKCWCGVCDVPAGKMCSKQSDCEGACQPAPRSKPDACETWTIFGTQNDPCIVTDVERNLGKCTALVPGTPGPDVWPLPLTRPNTSCFGGGGAIDSKIVALGNRVPFKDGRSVPTLASIACVPRSSDTLTDTTGGFPGVGLFEVKLEVTAVGGSSEGQ